MLIKSFTPLLLLSAGCHAFRVPPRSLRTPSTAQRQHVHFLHPYTSSTITFSPNKSIHALIPLRHRSMIEKDAAVDASINRSLRKHPIIANVRRKLNKILHVVNVQPSAALCLSLSIFLLSAFPDAAWAVQSGGRAGGRSRQSSSRSYSSRPSSSRSSSYSSRGSSLGSSRQSSGRTYNAPSSYSRDLSRGSSRQSSRDLGRGSSRQSNAGTHGSPSSYSRDHSRDSSRQSSTSHADSAPSSRSGDRSRGYLSGGFRPNMMSRGYSSGGYSMGMRGMRGMNPYFRRPFYSPFSSFYGNQSELGVRRGPSFVGIAFRLILSLYIISLVQSL